MDEQKQPNALQKLRNYFGMTSTEFAREWKELSAENKQWFKDQIAAIEE